MIQRIVQSFAISASRRVHAIFVIALLNLALVPCTMALEAVEQGHDCCPPELQLDLPECCEIDDVSIDKRDGSLELWDSPDYDDVSTGPLPDLVARAAGCEYSASDPPDPPGRTATRHKLFCRYLI